MSTKPAIFFEEVNERQGVFHRRAFLLGGLTSAGLVALGGRLAYLQVVQADRYRLLAEHNQFQFVLTPPPRGVIEDRYGVVLASNRPDFRLLLAKQEHVDIEAVLNDLAKLIPMDDARRKRLFCARDRGR